MKPTTMRQVKQKLTKMYPTAQPAKKTVREFVPMPQRSAPIKGVKRGPQRVAPLRASRRAY